MVTVSKNPGLLQTMWNTLPAMPSFLGGKPVVVEQPVGFLAKLGRVLCGIGRGLVTGLTCCGRCSKKPAPAAPGYAERMQSAFKSAIGSAIGTVAAHPKKTVALVASAVLVGVGMYTGHTQRVCNFTVNKMPALPTLSQLTWGWLGSTPVVA